MQLVNETVGWIGSALILVSLAQSQPRRLHGLNVAACVILVAYNLMIGAIPGIGLNIGLILVNLWRLKALPSATAVGGHSQGNLHSGTDGGPGAHGRSGFAKLSPPRTTKTAVQSQERAQPHH